MNIPNNEFDRKALASLALILVAALALGFALWGSGNLACESALPWVCG
jgi:hypothetical protein